MAYTTIDNPTQHFNTVTYSGTGATRSITGLGFSPDWTWIKERNNAVSSRLFDSVRGATKRMFSNNTDAESTQSNALTSFDSDGFSLGDSGSVNGGSDTYVAWNWRGSDSNAVSNSNGDITSTVSVNTTAGFSIGTYTGDGNNTHSVGHGLGATPAWIIIKRREGSHSWIVWHQNLTATSAYALDLENTDGQANNVSYFHDTAPDANTFHPGDGGATNGSGGTYVFYAFKEIKGYSKFGSYKGNGNADGTFVYTGFKPAWVMMKSLSALNGWNIFDSVRGPFNPTNEQLQANSNNAGSSVDFDILSNGFKLRTSSTNWNGGSDTYIYMAFAESPFVSSAGVPTTAR